MKNILVYIAFFVLNFGALALGGLFTGSGVASDWYANMNQAPWTPPGWVFGAAWTSIMICYSIYMARAWNRIDRKKLAVLFSFQWVLNVSWNPVFFYLHETEFALLLITALTLLLLLKIVLFRAKMKYVTFLLMPYFIWLCIATSLNAYIVVNN